MSIQFFENQIDFRNWLLINHAIEKEIWLGFYNKKSNLNGISYKDAIDEALCFGWIDGIRKSIDDIRYTNRFTPRTTKSIWSQVNINRVAELTNQGKMHPSGIKVFENRDTKMEKLYSHEQEKFELSSDYENIFKENVTGWSFFQNQAPSYKKQATWWVISAKQVVTRQKRLNILIECSEKGEKVPPFRRP